MPVPCESRLLLARAKIDDLERRLANALEALPEYALTACTACSMVMRADHDPVYCAVCPNRFCDTCAIGCMCGQKCNICP